MKKLLILFIILLFNTFLIYALNLDDVYMQLKNLKEIENNIKFKELEITKLKLKSTNNAWDFINRRSNEQIIQKRSNLMRELNNLYFKQQQIIDDLLNKREEIIKNLDKYKNIHSFVEILNSLDDLQYNKLIQLDFDFKITNNNELNKRHLELLKSKRKEIMNYLDYLELKQKLFKELNKPDFSEQIIKQRENLKNKIDKLDNLIKNFK
jgi:hypothetical protein